MTPRVFKAMLAKDLKREWRSKEIFISGFLFSVILLTVIYFAVDNNRNHYEDMAAGSIWLCLLFSGTIGLNRIHQSELNNGCYRALIMAPTDGGKLYLAKLTANFLLLAVMVVMLLPLVALFFNINPFVNPIDLLATLGLGLLAFTAVGTLVVAITANTRMKDVLFPIVQLPLVVPILIAGVNATDAALHGEVDGSWLQFLTAVNLVFISVGYLLYEFLLEE